MNFHLEFPIPAFPVKIKYSDKLLFIGSCFAENIGEKMQQAKFNAQINPHGILYNPAAIVVALKRYIHNKPLNENELFSANECWNSWEHHSRFSHPDKSACLEKINREISNAHEQLKQSTWLFITFGSAFSYSLKEGNIPVGNCHKVPQKEFFKSLLETDEIVKAYDFLFKELKIMNPALNIVLTVSPVRYIRDGVVENNLSKSVLIQSAHKLVQHNENVFYFPAYELVIDDLRDYRFYKRDLVHPSEEAIDYVFSRFMENFDGSSKTLFEEIVAIINAKNHRAIDENSSAHKKFKNKFAEECTALQKKFPFLDLKEEIEYFSK